ncbi:hypothetical protein I4F81_010973 [Pyropia yezoensis]|uniref:Uncharacterized protein n=1 Tax=Pyropia yezoensis TaxID=2788 RepID=A0ACC3CE86_PYRYE|nr:hypothetical protein I4F81_010973 [Neopyropia yezoensis]
MRTSGFTEQGTPRPDGRSSAGYGPPQPGVVPLQLPSASLQYGPSGLSLFSPGMPAAGVAAGDADEPAQLDARGLFYNHADRTQPKGDDVFTAGHPMAAWSASPLSNDTHGLLGAAAAALRDAPARAVNGSGAVHVPFPSHAGGHVHASTVGLVGGPRGEVALVAASGSLIPPGGALARPVGDSYRSYTHHWSSESSSMPVPRRQARAPPMQLNIRPMRNGGAPESSATDTAAPSSSAPGLPLAPAPVTLDAVVRAMAVGFKAVGKKLVRLQKSVDGLAKVVGTSAGKLDNFSVLAQSVTTADGVTAAALAELKAAHINAADAPGGDGEGGSAHSNKDPVVDRNAIDLLLPELRDNFRDVADATSAYQTGSLHNRLLLDATTKTLDITASEASTFLHSRVRLPSRPSPTGYTT